MNNSLPFKITRTYFYEVLTYTYILIHPFVQLLIAEESAAGKWNCHNQRSLSDMW